MWWANYFVGRGELVPLRTDAYAVTSGMGTFHPYKNTSIK